MVLGALWKRSNKARNSGLFFRRSFFNGRSPAIKDLIERDSLDNHARDSDCGVVTRVQPRSRRIVCNLRTGKGWREVQLLRQETDYAVLCSSRTPTEKESLLYSPSEGAR